MTAYVVNQNLKTYKYDSQSWMTWVSENMYFADYVADISGVPTEITCSFWLDSYGASGTSNMGYVYMSFYDEKGTLLRQEGLTTNNSGYYNKLNVKVTVPPETSYFKIAAKIRAFMSNRVQRTGRAQVDLIDMTYSLPVAEPKTIELEIATSVEPLATNVVRALEIARTSVIHPVRSETTIQAQKVNYSHMEPLRTTATKHALTITSIKGIRISTIAFTNVKTASSSLIKTIHSHNDYEIRRSKAVTSTSFMKDVLTRSERVCFAVRQVNSHVSPIESVSEAEFEAAPIVRTVTTFVSKIKTNVSVRAPRSFYLNEPADVLAKPAKDLKFAFGGNVNGDYTYAYIPVSFESGRIIRISLVSSYDSTKGAQFEAGFAVNQGEAVAFNVYNPSYSTHYITTLSVPDDANFLVLKLSNNYLGKNVYVAPMQITTDSAGLEALEAVTESQVTSSKRVTTGYDVTAPYRARITTAIQVASSTNKATFNGVSTSASYGFKGDLISFPIGETGTKRFYVRNTFTEWTTEETVPFTFAERMAPERLPSIKTNTVSSFVDKISSDVITERPSARESIVVSSSVASIRSDVNIEAAVHLNSFSEPYRSSVLTKSVMHSRTSSGLITSSVGANVTVTSQSFTGAYKSSAEAKAAVYPTSFSKPYESSLDVATKSRISKVEVTVASKMGPVASDSILTRKIKRTAESYAESILSQNEVKITANAKSHVEAITANVARLIARKPIIREFVSISTVGHVQSNATKCSHREVSHQSYAKSSFSSVLLSYQPNVTSAMSIITSGAAIKRNSVSITVDVGSIVKPITFKTLTERRKLKMRLNELKIRLRIPAEDTSNDDLLLVLLDDAIDFVQRTCNQEFELIPPTAKKVITQHVAYELNGNGYIISETIAGMSQKFETSEQRDKSLSNILRKAGLIKLRFA